MDYRQIVQIVRRRRVAAILLLIVTLGATAAVAMSIPVSYSATAKVLLQPPVVGADGGPPGNPLTASSGSVTTISDVVVQVVNSEATRDRLTKAGADDYLVSPAEGDVPLLAIQATSEDRDVALSTVSLVTEAVDTVLSDQQRLTGAPEATFVTARTLVPADRTQAITGRRARTVAGVLGLGLALSLTALVVADGMAAGRRPLIPRRVTPEPSTLEDESEPALSGLSLLDIVPVQPSTERRVGGERG